ncbi:MAG TPA: hypothetical protein VM617_03295 [Thermoanaerobaculia bacterium]|nr:hypothetical protein [Thermoanaerobaculia bacterium]
MTAWSGLAARSVTWAVLVALAAVAASRGVEATRSPLPLDAHGERTWLSWSYRDPRADWLLAGRVWHLRGAPCAVLVVGGGDDPAWWRIKATYHFHRQRVVVTGDRGRAAAADPRCAVLVRRSNGRLRLLERAAR